MLRKSQAFMSIITLAAAAGMTVASPALAKSKSSISKTENKLLAAGFEARPANNPKRLAMLTRLPANKFVQRTNGDNVAYVYADPKDCHCLYVGSQAAYGAYQRQKQAQKIVDEQRDTAEDFQDAQWDWGAWGPWGPRWSRFGFGLHPGW